MIPFVGPSHPLPLDRVDLQRSINLYPVQAEDAGEKSQAHLMPTPGLTVWSAAPAYPNLSVDNATGGAIDGATFTLTVVRSGDLSFVSTVDWVLGGSDPWDGTEGFRHASGINVGTLTFAAGDASETIALTLNRGTFRSYSAILQLSNAAQALVVDGTGTIDAAVPAGATPVRWDTGAIDPAIVQLSNGDRTVTRIGGANSVDNAGAVSTRGVATGKFYVEFLVNVHNPNGITGSNLTPGLSLGDEACALWVPGATTFTHFNNISGPLLGATAWLNRDGTSAVANVVGTPLGAAVDAGQRGMLAYDVETQKVWFGRQGTWQGDPAAGTGGYSVPLLAPPVFCITALWNILNAGDSITLCADAADQAYSPPAGFVPMSEAG